MRAAFQWFEIYANLAKTVIQMSKGKTIYFQSFVIEDDAKFQTHDN